MRRWGGLIDGSAGITLDIVEGMAHEDDQRAAGLYVIRGLIGFLEILQLLQKL